MFGYITRLLIPTNSVVKISKEKTARIIPNAVAVVTDDARHVFGSLLSRDSTYKLMMEVWQAATELKNTEEVAKPISLPLPIQRNCELNAEEDDSSVSENGGEFVSRSEDNVCINPLINDESTIAGVFPKLVFVFVICFKNNDLLLLSQIGNGNSNAVQRHGC